MIVKKTLLFFALFLFVSIETFAQLSPADSVLEGNINSNAFLSKSKKYLLRGFVNVNPPATLTIEAGTIIYGEQSSKGTLIINRGAKINANGTANAPIVFTSQQPAGQRAAGDWGGIILAGYATINVPGGTATLEGGTGTVYGGGATPNDDDNSGVMRYVRIEFPGIAFLPDNEINGLTFGGVGRGTTIEYIQVSYSGDDSYEWFGGTVNCKNLIAFKGVDDEFDTDFGFRGNLQFLFGLRDPNIADISGSNGFESDNDGSGTTNTPRTQPIFSNVTFVGPLTTPDFTAFNPNFKRLMHIRRSSLLSLYNSIGFGYPIGLFIQSQASADGAVNGDLQMRNCIIAGSQTGKLLTTDVAGFDVAAWYNTASFSNRTFATSTEVGLIDPFNLTNPNPVPGSSSPAVSGADFTNARLSGGFFTPTTYVGAFDPNAARWDAGWTNYTPETTNYVTSVEESQVSSLPVNFNLSQNYPNPFNPSTKIVYSVAEPSQVKLVVTNILGQVVETLVNDFRSNGTYEVNFDASKLTSGLYIYTLEAGSTKISKKMTLLK